MTTRTFSIGGLHCDGCVKSVQSILSAQPGVTAAKVDLASAHASVEATPAFDAGAAVQAVTKAGFTMTPA